jgi:hypothetical protein
MKPIVSPGERIDSPLLPQWENHTLGQILSRIQNTNDQLFRSLTVFSQTNVIFVILLELFILVGGISVRLQVIQSRCSQSRVRLPVRFNSIALFEAVSPNRTNENKDICLMGNFDRSSSEFKTSTIKFSKA